jgi:hypothetical protein
MVREKYETLYDIDKINALRIDPKFKEVMKKADYEKLANLSNKLITCEERCRGDCQK